MKNEKEFREIAATLNDLRLKNKNQTFTTAELDRLLTGIVPISCMAKALLVNTNIIIRIKKGCYSFPGNPIPWTSVRNFYNSCRERQHNYRTKNSKLYLYGRPIATVIRDIKSLGFEVYQRV